MRPPRNVEQVKRALMADQQSSERAADRGGSGGKPSVAAPEPPTSMEADLDYADIQQPMPLANAIVLKELAHRASLGRDCLAGMEEYYAIVRNRTGAGSRGERMRP